MPGSGYDLPSFKAIQMNSRSFKIQQSHGRIDVPALRLWQRDGRGVEVHAPNNDCECFEQMVFERAVRRELSGDVDFE